MSGNDEEVLDLYEDMIPGPSDIAAGADIGWKEVTAKRKKGGDSSTDVSPSLPVDKKKPCRGLDNVAVIKVDGENETDDEDDNDNDHEEEIKSPNLFVYIKGKTSNIVQLAKSKPIQIKKALSAIIDNNEQIKLTGQTLRIRCKDANQKDYLMKMTQLLDVEIDVSEPFSVSKIKHQNDINKTKAISYNKGIIFGIPLDITDDELKFEIKATWLQRMTQRSGNQFIPTTTVIFAVDAADLPESVMIGYIRKRVKRYIPRPLRCLKCQMYGHKMSQCYSANIKCPRCGGKHGFDDCKVLVRKCPNCAGSHSAGFRECVKYKEVQATLQVSVTQNIPFAQAARKIRKTQKDLIVNDENFPSLTRSTNVNNENANPIAAQTISQSTMNAVLHVQKRSRTIETQTETIEIQTETIAPSVPILQNKATSNAKQTKESKINDEVKQKITQFCLFTIELLKKNEGNKSHLRYLTQWANSKFGTNISPENTNNIQ